MTPTPTPVPVPGVYSYGMTVVCALGFVVACLLVLWAGLRSGNRRRS